MISLDVDTAVTVPVNVMPLLDDTDFKTRETAIAYNAAGMDLVWNFITSAGVITQTAVTPTTSGVYDWTHVGDGMYKIEIPASGGASINNDTEGYGWFSGVVTGVLPFRGPTVRFRAAALNDALCDGGDVLDVNLTQWLGTAAATPTVAGVPEVDVTHVGGSAEDLPTATALATAQTDLDTLTGSDGVTLATSQPNYAPNTATPLDAAGVRTAVGLASANLDTQLGDIDTDIQTLLGRITSTLFSGITSLAEWLGAMAGKQTANSTARTEIRATGAGSGTFDETTDSLEGILDRGNAAWTTGGGGSISDIINVQPLIPPSIDVANTASWRIGLMLINSLDDLPSTAEITPGTISIERKAIGGTSWSAIVTDAACSELAGLIYYDEVFNSGTGYAEGDSIRITFKSQKVTVSANDYEIIDSNGRRFYTSIRQPNALDAAATRAAVGLASANLDSQFSGLNDLDAAGVRSAVGLASANLDSQFSGLNDLDAAGVRSAVGLASANLDTQFSNLNDLDAAGVRSAVGLASANLDTQLGDIDSDTSTLVSRITSNLFTGITSLANWLRLMARSDAAIVTDAATAASEINDDLGSGAGDYSSAADSLEAISDSGGGGLTQQQVRDAMKLAPTAGSPASGSVDDHLDDILTDTGTTLDGKLDDIQGATFDTSTDSLEAIRNRGDAAWTTGAGGSASDVTVVVVTADLTGSTLNYMAHLEINGQQVGSGGTPVTVNSVSIFDKDDSAVSFTTTPSVQNNDTVTGSGSFTPTDNVPYKIEVSLDYDGNSYKGIAYAGNKA